MTVNEMREALEQFCNSQPGCMGCPLCFGECTLGTSDDEITENYNSLFGGIFEEEPTPIEPEHDVIKHPNHYCRDGAMECIDEMVLVFGKEVVKHFCLCNIWKYRYRSSAKNGEEDIKKSDRYIQMYERLCSDE